MCHVQSGKQFEKLVLGECIATVHDYMSWTASLNLVRKSQPKEKTEIVEMLESELFELVGPDVRYCTCVHTPLDYFHQVDAFFECNGVFVTLDATINDEKTCCKADILVTYEKVCSRRAVHLLAVAIAREFNAKMQKSQRYAHAA